MTLACFLTAGGCAKGTYNAKKLPRELFPQPNLSIRQIDMSRIPRSTVPSDWLSPGDVVAVSVATGAEKSVVPEWKLRIDGQGQIDVPVIGRVSVAGTSAADAALRIQTASVERGVYIDPKITVAVIEKYAARITVVGAVKTPSTYELPLADCNLLGALTAAEGLSADANTILEIRHSPSGLQNKIARYEAQRFASRETNPNHPSLQLDPPPQPTTTINLAEVEKLHPNDLELFDGSVVYVHRRSPRRAYIDGLVRQPKSVDLPEGESFTLLQTVALAGGVTNSLANKVIVVRPNPLNGKLAIIEASLRAARRGGADNLIIGEGDMITIAETPATYVTDAMRSFFRVGFSAAMPGF